MYKLQWAAFQPSLFQSSRDVNWYLRAPESLALAAAWRSLRCLRSRCWRWVRLSSKHQFQPGVEHPGGANVFDGRFRDRKFAVEEVFGRCINLKGSVEGPGNVEIKHRKIPQY